MSHIPKPPANLVENLLALAGIACIVIATAGLAGMLYGLLLLGLLLVLMAYALQAQPAPVSSDVATAVESATTELRKRFDVELRGTLARQAAELAQEHEKDLRRLGVATGATP